MFCEHSEEVEKVCAPSNQVMATTASTCCDAEHSQLVIILALSLYWYEALAAFTPDLSRRL